MARKGSNGAVLITLSRTRPHPSAPTQDYTEVFTFHTNGHILRNAKLDRRSIQGWKQWAIVPIDGMGSVVQWMRMKGWEEVAP